MVKPAGLIVIKQFYC